MRVLDLFAGLCGWSAPFANRGHEVYSVDLDTRFDVSSHADILTLTAADLPWKPDIILASPPCEAFSVLTIGRNWGSRSSGDGGPFQRIPKTDKARLAVQLVEATRRLIDEIAPSYFVIENPRAVLRKLPPLGDLERRTVSYCRFGMPFRKPTDLWGGFPPSLSLDPVCTTTRGRLETDERGLTWTITPEGERCHLSAPRGSRTGIQGDGVAWLHARATASAEIFGTWDKSMTAAYRAKVPEALALAVCLAAETDLAVGAMPVPTTLWAVA